ncbi:hypothetical protein ACP70R_042035 [Stipagrostis hirtigluma subsp. patula]
MMLRQGGGGGFLEEALIVGGLLLVQCILAGYVVFVGHLLGLGADPLAVIVVYGAALAAFFLPFAVALERKKWPSRIPGTLMAQLVIIALGGTTAYQELMLLGIKKTTPAIASAMPNLSPGMIFIIAACCRLERFDKACRYTQAKILGTLVCLVGAMAMSFLQSPPSSPASDLQAPLTTISELSVSSYYDWILGCSFLVVAVIILSINMVLQAVTLISFPAPLTMCTITSAMGAVFTLILQVVLEGKIDIGSPRIDATLIAGIVLLGGVFAGSCIVFQTWCLAKKGPLFVSVFGPMQTVFSGILSAALFGQTVSLGSSTGIVLMFTGLYIVLWAKNNELPGDQVEHGADAEKALLS